MADEIVKDNISKKFIGIIIFIITTASTTAITYYVTDYLQKRGDSKEKVTLEVNKVLDRYSCGLNTHSFDAYGLFSNPVDQFITMKNVSPTEIDNYINRYYYKQFLKPTVTFDKQSLVIGYTDENGTQVEIVENEEFVRAATGKLEQHRTKARIYFTKDYKIRVFTLYQIIS